MPHGESMWRSPDQVRIDNLQNEVSRLQSALHELQLQNSGLAQELIKAHEHINKMRLSSC